MKHYTQIVVTGVSALLALASPCVAAAEPCPAPPEEADALPATRGEVQELARRAFDGYRARDNRVVREARCDLERAVPRLAETLGTADVARVHMTYALDESMAGEPDEAVTRYLVAARASDPYADDLILALTEEGDALRALYATLEAPEAASMVDYTQINTALPPAWRGTVRVNGGDLADAPGGPYMVQVVGRGAAPSMSYYQELGRAPVPYTRRRPVQLGLMTGAAGLALASLGAGAYFAGQWDGDGWEVPSGQIQGGSDLERELGEWRVQQQQRQTLNHAFVGAATGFGAVAMGLGVWFVVGF